MVRAGILREGEPLELIGGVLVYKDRSERGEDPMTVGKRHNLVVKLLARLDPELARLGCHMQTQGPLSLPPYDEPEPDGLILRGEPRGYLERVPQASDAACIIEVADSSLAYDRSQKLSLYARAGIEQYIIVNLRENVLEVYEGPIVDEARYAAMTVRRAGDGVSLRVPAGGRFEVETSRLLP
jgi:hypothetical protein